MRIGVVGTLGGWSSELLADTVAERTGERILIDLAEARFDLDRGEVWFHDLALSTLDALIIKKIGAFYAPFLLDRLEMLRFLADRGLPIFSDPLRIMRILDRLSCTVTLRLNGIPMPPTTITESVDEALATLAAYGQAVFKPLYSSKARGMCILTAGQDGRDEIETFQQNNPVMYIQKKINLGGRDLGLVFLGGRYLTTYARCNNGAWNTTTESGGKYQPYQPCQEIIELAHRAQEPFGLDFTCVDVVECEDGPVIFEVSAFGGFRGIQETSDLDPARLYVDYVVNKVTKP
jgi:tetrahydromethanopterin:alpha-L-glutamate ligase